MKKKCVFIASVLLVMLVLPTLVSSCSSSDEDSEEKKEITNEDIPGYRLFRDEKKTFHDTFDEDFGYGYTILMFGTWSRDSIVSADGSIAKPNGHVVEITPKYVYKETIGGKSTSHRIRQWQTKDAKLLLTLDNDSVVRYDSIVWDVYKCCVVSKDAEGRTYRDYKKDWTDVKNVGAWCGSLVIVN